MSEGQIQDAIRLALTDEPGLVLWRNNTGVAERRAVAALGRRGKAQVPRGRVLCANVAVGLRGAVVRLVPHDEVRGRMLLSRRERLHRSATPVLLRHSTSPGSSVSASRIAS